MVLAGAAEARRQRILSKRESAKKENNGPVWNATADQLDLSLQEEGESTSFVGAQEQRERKPTLATLDVNTVAQATENYESSDDEDGEMSVPDATDMIANVYRFLKQEYKFVQLRNGADPQLRSLADIQRRTAEATGFSKDMVRKIVRQDRGGSRRRRNH